MPNELTDAINQALNMTSDREVRYHLRNALAAVAGAPAELTDSLVERMHWHKPVEVNGTKRAHPDNTRFDNYHRGLHVVVTQREEKAWKLRIRRGGKDKIVVLGLYPTMRHSDAVRAWEQYQITGDVDTARVKPKPSKAQAELTLSGLIDLYLVDYCERARHANGKPVMSDGVRKSTASTLHRFMDAFEDKFGDRPAAEVTAQQVREVALPFQEKHTVYITEADGRRRPVTRGGKYAYNNLLKALGQMQRVAQGGVRELMLPKPWLPGSVEPWATHLPKHKDATGRALTDVEQRHLLEKLDTVGMPVFAVNAIKLLMLSGLRISEALALTAADIHYQGASPYITVRTSKTSSTYHVPMSPQLKAVILDQIDTEWGHFLFTTNRGTVLTPDRLRDYLKRHAKVLGLEGLKSDTGSPFGAHWFRHTFLTIGKELGFHKEIRDAAINHKSSGSVDALYTSGADHSGEVAQMVYAVADRLVERGMKIPS